MHFFPSFFCSATKIFKKVYKWSKNCLARIFQTAYNVFVEQVAAKVRELDDERKKLYSKLQAKQEDAFQHTVEIEMGLNKFSALCDLGASVSTIPKSVYDSLNLVPYANTEIILNMANSILLEQ